MNLFPISFYILFLVVVFFSRFIIVWKVTINRRLKTKKLLYDQKRQTSAGKPKGLEKNSLKVTSDSCKSRNLQSPHANTREQVCPTSKLRSEKTGDDRRLNSDKKVSAGRIPTLGDQILNKGRLSREEKFKRDAASAHHSAKHVRKLGDVHQTARNPTVSTKAQELEEKSGLEVSRPTVSKTKTISHVKIDKFNEVTCLRAEDVQDKLSIAKEKKTVVNRTEFAVPKTQAAQVKTEPEVKRNEPVPSKIPSTAQMIKKEEVKAQEPTCSQKIVHNGGKVSHQVPLASCEITSWDTPGSILSGWRLEKSVHLSLTTDTSVVTADDAVTDLMAGDFGNIRSKYMVNCEKNTRICSLDATAEMKENDQAEWALSPLPRRCNEVQKRKSTRTEIHRCAKGWIHCQQPSPDEINVRKRSQSTRLQGRRLGSDLAYRPMHPRLVHSSVTLQSSSNQIGLVPEENMTKDIANVKRARFERLQILAPVAEGSHNQSDLQVVRKDGSYKRSHKDDETIKIQNPPHQKVVPYTGKRTNIATEESKVLIPMTLKKKKGELVKTKRRSPKKRMVVAKIVGRLKVRKHRPKEKRTDLSQINESSKEESLQHSVTRKEVIGEKLQSHPQNPMTKYLQGNGSIHKPKSPFLSSSAASIINKETKKEPFVDSSKALFSRSSSFLSKSGLHDNCFVTPDSKRRPMSTISVARTDAESKTITGCLKAIKPDALNWQEPLEEVSKLKQCNLSSHLGPSWTQMGPPIFNTKPGLNIETEQKKMEKPCKRFDDSEVNRKGQLEGFQEMPSRNFDESINLSRPPTERKAPPGVSQEHLSLNHPFVKVAFQPGNRDDLLYNKAWSSRKQLEAERIYPCHRARSKVGSQIFVPPDAEEKKDVYTSFAYQPDRHQRQTTGHNDNVFAALKPEECQNLESMDFRDIPLKMASGDNLKSDKNEPTDTRTGFICQEKEIGQSRAYPHKTTVSRDLAMVKEDSVFRYDQFKLKKVVDPWAPGGYSMLIPGQGSSSNESVSNNQKFENPTMWDARNKERGFTDTGMVPQQHCSMLGFAINHTQSSSKGSKNEFLFPNLVRQSHQFKEENQIKQTHKNGAAVEENQIKQTQKNGAAVEENQIKQTQKDGATVEENDQVGDFLEGTSDILPSSLFLFKKTGKSSKLVEKVRRGDLKRWTPSNSGHSVHEKNTKHYYGNKILNGDDGYRVQHTVPPVAFPSKSKICPDLDTGKRRVSLNGKIPDNTHDITKIQAHKERGFLSFRTHYLSKPTLKDQQYVHHSLMNFDRDDTDTSKSKLLPKRSDIKSSEMTQRKISSPSPTVTDQSKKTKAKSIKSKIPRYVFKRAKRCVQTETFDLNAAKTENSRHKNEKVNTETVSRSNSDENKNKQTRTSYNNFGNISLGRSQLKKNTQMTAAKDHEKKQKIYQLSEFSEDQADTDRIKFMKAKLKRQNRLITNSRHFKLSSSNSSQDVSDATSLFKNNLEESIFMVKPKKRHILHLEKGITTGSQNTSLGVKDTIPIIQSHLEKITKHKAQLNKKQASKRRTHLEKITKHKVQLNEKLAAFKKTHLEAKHFLKVRHKKLALPYDVDDEENDYRNTSQQESSTKTTVWSDSHSSVKEINEKERNKMTQRHLEKLHTLSVVNTDSDDNWGRRLLQKSKTENKFTLKGSLGKRSATEEDDGNEIVKQQRPFLQDDDSLEVDKKYESKRKQERNMNGMHLGNIPHNSEIHSGKCLTCNLEGSYKNKCDINTPDVNRAKIKTKRQLWDSVLNKVKVKSTRNHERKMKQAHTQSDDINHENDREPVTKRNLKTKFETERKEQLQKTLFSTNRDVQSSEGSSVSDRVNIGSAPQGVQIPELNNAKRKVPYHVISFEDFSSSQLTLPTICHTVSKRTQERVDNKRHRKSYLSSLNETLVQVPTPGRSSVVDTKQENISLTEKTCSKHNLVPTQEEQTFSPQRKNKCFLAPAKRVVQRPPKSPTLSPDTTKVGMKSKSQQDRMFSTRWNSISRESGDVPKHTTKKDEGKKEINPLGPGNHKYPDERVNERKFTLDRLSKSNKSQQFLRDMKKYQSHARFTQQSPRVLEKNKSTPTYFSPSKKATTEVNKKKHDTSDVFRPGNVSSPPATVTNSPHLGFHRPAKSCEKRPSNGSLSNIKSGHLKNSSVSQRLITSPINRQRNEKFESAKNKITSVRQELSPHVQENVTPQKKSHVPINREFKTLQSPKESRKNLTGHSSPSSKEETMKVGLSECKRGIQRKPIRTVKTKPLSITKCQNGKMIWQAPHRAPPEPRNKPLETDGDADGILNEDALNRRLKIDSNRTSTLTARIGTRSKPMNGKDNPMASTGLSHSPRPEKRNSQKRFNGESEEKWQVNRSSIATMQQRGLNPLPNQETVSPWRRSGRAETENDRQKISLTILEEEDLGLPDHLPSKIRSNTEEFSSGSLQRLSPKNKRFGSPKQSKLTGGYFSSTLSPSILCTKKARICEHPTDVDALREKYLKEMKSKRSHVDIQFHWNSDGPGKQHFQKVESKPVQTRAERQRAGVPKTLLFHSKPHENKTQKLPVKTTGKEPQLSGLKRSTNDSTRSFLTNNDVSHTTFKETSTAKGQRAEVFRKDTQITDAQCPPSLGSITQQNSFAAASQNTTATYTQLYRGAAENRNLTYSTVDRNLRKRPSQSKVRLLPHASNQVANKIRDVVKPATDLQIAEHFDSLLKSTSSHPKQTTGTYTIARYPSTQCIFSPGGVIDSSTGTESWPYRTSANLADSYSKDSVELGNARLHGITRDLLKYMDKNSGTASGLIKEEFRHSNLDSKFISGARPNHGHGKENVTTQERKDDSTLNKCKLNEMSRPENEQENSQMTGKLVSKDSVSEHTSDEDLVSWIDHSDTHDKDHGQELSPAPFFTPSSRFKGTMSDISPLRTIWGFQGDPEAMTMPAQPRRMNLPTLEEIDEGEHKQNQPRITRISKRVVKQKAMAENSQETVGSNKSKLHKDKKQKDRSTFLSKSDLENNVTSNFREQGSSTVCLDGNVDVQNDITYAASQSGNGEKDLNVLNTKSINKFSSQEMDLEKKVEVTRKNFGYTQKAPSKINVRANTDRKLYVTSALRYNRKKQRGQSNKQDISPLGINNSANLKTVDRFHSRSRFRTKSIINDSEKNSTYKCTTRNPALESTKTYFKTQIFSKAALITENANRHLSSPSSSAQPRTLDLQEQSMPLSSNYYLQENSDTCRSSGNGSTNKSQSTYSEQPTLDSRTYMASADRMSLQGSGSHMGRSSESQHEADHNHRHRDSQDDAADEKSEEITTTIVPTMTQLNFDWYKPASTTNRLTNENRQTTTEQPITAAGGQSNRTVRREISEGEGLQSSGRVGGYFRGAVGGQMEDVSSGPTYIVLNGHPCNRTPRPPSVFRGEASSSQLSDQRSGNSVSELSSPFTFTGRSRKQMPVEYEYEAPGLSRPLGNFVNLNELPSTAPQRLDLPRPYMMEYEEINQRVPICSRVRYEHVLPSDASDPHTFTVPPYRRVHDVTFPRCQNSDSNSQSQTFNLNISNASTEYQNLQRNYNRANQLFHSNWLLANQNHSLNALTTGNIGHIHASTDSTLLSESERCPRGQVHHTGNLMAQHTSNDASRALAGQHLRYLSVEQQQLTSSSYSATPHGGNIPIDQPSSQLQAYSNPTFCYPQAISDFVEQNHNRLVFQNRTFSLTNSFQTPDTVTENEALIALKRPSLEENQIVQRLKQNTCERNVPDCSCLRLRHEESCGVYHPVIGPGTVQDRPVVQGGSDNQTVMVRPMFGMFEQSHQRQRPERFG